MRGERMGKMLYGARILILGFLWIPLMFIWMIGVLCGLGEPAYLIVREISFYILGDAERKGD